MRPEQEFAIRAIENSRGDDLARARMTFAGCDEAVLDKQYGQSGKTRREILKEYEAHEEEVEAALAWLKSVKS